MKWQILSGCLRLSVFLEPEQVLQNKWIIAATLATGGVTLWRLTTRLPLLEWFHFLRPFGY